MLKIGIVGAGWAGEMHLVKYREIPDAEVVAIADKDTDCLQNLTNNYNIDQWYTDHAEMAKQVDIVDVCTPTSTHAEIVTDVLDASQLIGVLVEKPMEANSDDCMTIIEACDSHDTVLGVCHNRLYHPSLNTVDFQKTPEFVKTTWRGPGPGPDHWKWDSNRDALLWEEGTHNAYVLQKFMPEIKSVNAVGRPNSDGVYDICNVCLNTSDNVTGVMELYWIPELEKRQTIELFDGDSHIECNLYYQKMEEGTAQRIVNRMSFNNEPGRSKRLKISGHKEFLTHFIRSIENGEEPPATGEDGLEAIRLLEYIEQALETGEKIRIK